MRAHKRLIAAASLLCTLACALAAGQAGRKPGTGGEVGKERGVFLNVVAARADGSEERITSKELALYDGGTEQNIQSFVPDPGPARRRGEVAEGHARVRIRDLRGRPGRGHRLRPERRNHLGLD